MFSSCPMNDSVTITEITQVKALGTVGSSRQTKRQIEIRQTEATTAKAAVKPKSGPAANSAVQVLIDQATAPLGQ
jgi:hypothetical protein